MKQAEVTRHPWLVACDANMCHFEKTLWFQRDRMHVAASKQASTCRSKGPTQAWVDVQGGMCVFSVYFWHSERWTPRNEALLEAVLKRARVTEHSWLMACETNMSPAESEKSLWFRRNRMHVAARKDASTCRSKGAKGEWIERTYDNVITCKSLKGEITQMEVVEDFDSTRTKQCPSWLRGKRRYRNGTSRSCRRCCLVTVEEGCQEEAPEKQVETKRRKRTVEKGESGVKSLVKWLRASRTRQARMRRQRRLHKEQRGKVSSKNWDCSQIENEEEDDEEEEEEHWQKENQKEMQWAEDEKLEELLEQRRMEGCSL